MKELARIQQELSCPKSQFNKFGKYNYRSCEDILEGLKKVLGECTLTIQDEIVQVGERIYVQATATLKSPDGEVETGKAFAREAEIKKGMDESQITGTASSYARKYALNGLFCIDDTKDADTMDNSKSFNEPKKKPAANLVTQEQVVEIKQKVKSSGLQEQPILMDWKLANFEALMAENFGAMLDYIDNVVLGVN